MACFHLYGDADGDTHLMPLPLPERETPVGPVRSLPEIPVTTAGLAAFVGRKPGGDLHTAPRRQFVLVLGGELAIVTTGGVEHRLGPGDLMLADDVGSKGHLTLDVGGDPLVMMTVGIDPTWSSPPT
jgi:hypothetical protein